MTLRDVAGCHVSCEALVNRIGILLVVCTDTNKRKLVLTNGAEEWELEYVWQDRFSLLRLHAAVMTFVLTEMPQRGNKTT